MYFAYIDETGIDGTSPVTVLVGIVVNEVRATKSRVDLAEILTSLSSVTDPPMSELKARDLMRGKGVWRRVPGETRANVVTNICGWLNDRRHTLALAAIDNEKFAADCMAPAEIGTPWKAGALHLALQLQRAHQPKKRNKGNTVLVFDDNKVEASNFVDLMYDPPEWTDDFYGRPARSLRMDQIVDTPFVVKSHHIGLVQLADLFAAIFRRQAELGDFGEPEAYAGETERVTEWIEQLGGRLVAREHRHPARGGSDCAAWFRQMSPASLISPG
ncbi:DUF3800 domain-containing protein [Nocardioides panacisoli]|uniref:DUF3800 domain-containing protein n=1 Tax=Nocardioides panacisoli TaxID=627624 RepID=UPI001C62B5FD|nr:DUF3800 domain-containing protein [Nocardioides panacisoli]QYJ03504.1 DUF3800 domain-containing protein [Nocardioides panacisoli]